MIVGGGMVGYNAAIIALGFGAQVTILERSIDRMRHLEEILSGRVTLADVVEPPDRGVDRGRGPRDRRRAHPGRARAEARHPRDDRGMKAGAVFVDVAIDQGGCVETSHATTHTEPVYVVEGVTHYCVANMPGAVPITSTKALTNATLPYVEAIADHGLRERSTPIRPSRSGVNVVEGKITYEAVAEAHNLDYTPLEDVLRWPVYGVAAGFGFFAAGGLICTTSQVIARRERDDGRDEERDADETEDVPAA